MSATTTDRRHSVDDALVRSAARLFKERGVRGASMRAIADDAGIMLGSVTYRYKTKDDLVVAILREAINYGVRAVERAVEGREDPLERLRFALRAHLRVLLEEEDAAYVFLLDGPRLAPKTARRIGKHRKRYDDLWDGLIRNAALNGDLITNLDLDLAKAFVFGATNSVALWYSPKVLRSPDQIADAFSCFIALGLVKDQRRPRDSQATFAALHALYDQS